MIPLNRKHITMALAGLVLLAVLAAPVFAAFTDIRDVTPAEVGPYLAEHPDTVILDVRTPAEFAAGHIKGARNMDYYAREFPLWLQKLAPDARYLVYCRTGRRSASTVRLMERLGIWRIRHLAGGVREWVGSGGELVRGRD